MNRLPSWFKQELPNAAAQRTKQVILGGELNTVCQAALCPNISDCFGKSQATFMILGKYCTRNCRFCNVSIDKNRTVPNDEPQRIVKAVKALGLRYVVITAVTRDDLDDGGASQFVKVIELLRDTDQDLKIEVLIPDFKGNLESLVKVVNARPFVLAHNLETIKRLYNKIRPEADYERSLNLLKKAKELSASLITKSSLMLGFGEREEEIIIALQDLRKSGCAIVSLGQYLAPSALHYPVKEFVSPEQFRKYYDIGIKLGFKRVLSGPRVRSSYGAGELSKELELCMI